jgi:hypothetical protein
MESSPKRMTNISKVSLSPSIILRRGENSHCLHISSFLEIQENGLWKIKT